MITHRHCLYHIRSENVKVSFCQLFSFYPSFFPEAFDKTCNTHPSLGSCGVFPAALTLHRISSAAFFAGKRYKNASIGEFERSRRNDEKACCGGNARQTEFRQAYNRLSQLRARALGSC